MNADLPFHALPPDVQLRIDAACDRFEGEWQAGRVPDMAAYLEPAIPADRPALRDALARIEAEYRCRSGPSPSASQLSLGGSAVRLAVTAGPHKGQEFAFDRHDTFLVGRTKDAHFRLSYDDPYFSRRHFLVEVNPPRVRVLDLKSRNGIFVNGCKVDGAELSDGDEIKAGHTVFRVSVPAPDPDHQPTMQLTVSEGVSGIRVVDESSEDVFVVPGYQLGPVIGRGGMGVVYRANRLADNADVAIKAIVPAQGVGRKPVDRFLREAKVLSKLRHPNIVAFHEAGESKRAIYLVMEMVPGPDAEVVLKDRGPMEVKTAVRLICLLLSGVEHAHAKGFVHRDIKPANVLIGGIKRKRTVKLADFGLARAYETSKLSGVTMQGDVGGTPAYMAPEQVTHYRDVQPAADQYAVAATLYRLLTGKHIHDLPKSAGEQLVHILTEKPVPIRDRRADIPEGLAKVIHTALNREPVERFPDVAVLRAALLAFA